MGDLEAYKKFPEKVKPDSRPEDGDEESSRVQRKQDFLNSRHVGFTFPELSFPPLLSLGIFLLNLTVSSNQVQPILSLYVTTPNIY